MVKLMNNAGYHPRTPGIRFSPAVANRIEAMSRCADTDPSLRAVIMPVVPVTDGGAVYKSFIEFPLDRV